MLFINNLQEIKRFYKIEMVCTRLLKFVNLPASEIYYAPFEAFLNISPFC